MTTAVERVREALHPGAETGELRPAVRPGEQQSRAGAEDEQCSLAVQP